MLKTPALLAILLTMPSITFAGPVTLGTWSAMPAPDADQQPFWDGLSWDCPTCGVGFLLDGFGPLEYLNDGLGGFVDFAFEGVIDAPTLLYSITAWHDGTLGLRADGAFTYDSGTGRLSNSLDNGAQYALFRQIGPQVTRYFLGVEDILLSETANDRDYNDYVITFTQPKPVPEPSSLLLMGTAIAGLAARRTRRKRARIGADAISLSSPC
jgi:hypothetical protein